MAAAGTLKKTKIPLNGAILLLRQNLGKLCVLVGCHNEEIFSSEQCHQVFVGLEWLFMKDKMQGLCQKAPPLLRALIAIIKPIKGVMIPIFFFIRSKNLDKKFISLVVECMSSGSRQAGSSANANCVGIFDFFHQERNILFMFTHIMFTHN